MNRLFFFVCICLSLTCLTACPKKQVKPARVALSYGKKYIAWRTITKRKFPSQNHGNFVQQIYANDIALRTSNGDKPLPYKEGATFVMIMHNDEGTRQENAYVMRKMGSSYHPGYKNSLYTVVRLSDWTIERDGKLADCIRCHYKSRRRDYVPLMKKDNL